MLPWPFFRHPNPFLRPIVDKYPLRRSKTQSCILGKGIRSVTTTFPRLGAFGQSVGLQ